MATNTSKTKFNCNGDESSKHPLVYLQISQGEKSITCTYCSKKFTAKK